MGEGGSRLRDRMLRDAIVEVLRAAIDGPGGGDAISLVDQGLVRGITVDGDWARVQLVLTPKLRPFAGELVTEVRRRLESLPEVTRSEVDVID